MERQKTNKKVVLSSIYGPCAVEQPIYPNTEISYFDGIYDAVRYSQYVGFGYYRCYDRIGEEIFDVMYHGKVYLTRGQIEYVMNLVKQ